jgi:predicted amidophosphoribosyltransferase
MPTIRELTDPYVSQYCPVPLVAPEVACDVCHGPVKGWMRCYSCAQTVGQVSRPISRVLPISLCRKGTQFYHVMWNYKNGKATTARDRHRLQLAALLTRFLFKHRTCLEEVCGTGWDHLTIVTSSQGRAGPHPLERVFARVDYLASTYRPTLGPGTVGIGHNNADDRGYSVIGDVRGKRLLLIDDMFTSGGRLQSAASALRLAGATVVAAVVIARLIDVGFSSAHQTFWDQTSATPFDFETCGLDTHGE